MKKRFVILAALLLFAAMLFSSALADGSAIRSGSEAVSAISQFGNYIWFGSTAGVNRYFGEFYDGAVAWRVVGTDQKITNQIGSQSTDLLLFCHFDFGGSDTPQSLYSQSSAKEKFNQVYILICFPI